MPFYKVTATYLYEGVVEADNEDDAIQEFESDLNSHYVAPVSIDAVEEDDE